MIWKGLLLANSVFTVTLCKLYSMKANTTQNKNLGCLLHRGHGTWAWVEWWVPLSRPPLVLSSCVSTGFCSSVGGGGTQRRKPGRPAQMILGTGDPSFLHSESKLILCFASAGGRTNCASRTAGCATWHQRSSASCPPTRRRTSYPSPSTLMSLPLGRWTPS